MRNFFLLLILSLVLVACKENISAQSTSVVNTPLSIKHSDIAVTKTPYLTSSPEPTLLVQPIATFTPITTPTPTAAQIDLVRPIYILIGNEYTMGRDLYKIMPGGMIADHLNPVGEEITCFDLWEEAERLVFGTKQGKLFIQISDEKPYLLFDTSFQSPYPTEITGVSWSPDGDRLAFTVNYRDYELFKIPYPSKPSGAWVVDKQGLNFKWLISNNYVAPTAEYVTEFRVFVNPKWSPDGKALIFHHWHWEGSEQVWFDPIQAVKDDNLLLRDPEMGAWSKGVWSLDSQSIFLSGLGYSNSSSLVQISRDGKNSKILIDGEKNQLDIDEVFIFQDGFLFTAYEGLNEEKGPFLYNGTFSNGDVLQWIKLDSSPICDSKTMFTTEKGPGDDEITIICGNGNLLVISLSGDLIFHTSLQKLLQDFKYQIISFKWVNE